MLLAEVVETSRWVAEATGRLEKIGLLAQLLAHTPAEEVEIAIAFLSGGTRQGRIGIGPAALSQARPERGADSPALALLEVDRALGEIAAVGGRGSAARRVRLLRDLLARATAAEQDFLLRLLVGELRQGALEGVMLEAVARAAGLPAARIRRALMGAGDLGAVARVALSEGQLGLARFGVRLLTPVQPMLAQPADGVVAALDRLGPAALEYKLDGARIQVHKAGDEVRVFSRTLREVTGVVPEVVEAVRVLPAREAILDGEVIALQEDGAPHPFQVTMRRFGRKLDVGRMRRELPLTPFLFDLLYQDGEDLTGRAQAERFTALAELVGERLVVPHLLAATEAEALAFLDAALRHGHEGIMAKDPGAPYEAGSRGRAWLKVKPAHTLDLVVLAAEWGHGRRRGWLSNLHLGARDPEAGGSVMLGKTFKGLTDEMLAWQTQRLLELEIGRDAWTVYVRPELVVEIAFNDLQESTHYPGGLALRFARVKRYRRDKTAAEADSIAAVREIYRRQVERGSATR
jgi:DNA ligase-1